MFARFMYFFSIFIAVFAEAECGLKWMNTFLFYMFNFDFIIILFTNEKIF